MNKAIFKLVTIILAIYIFICGLLFLKQEQLIFFAQYLKKNYRFSFDQNFKEIAVKLNNGITLNGVLFKAENTKGVVFYLHGNAGSISSWGAVSKTYTNLGYHVFMLDYRGYGKSEGLINNEDELFSDAQTVYNKLKKTNDENKIVVLGYSLGTGIAAKIASDNKPKLLILQAPYYNLSDLMKSEYLIIPTFILKYKFATNKFLENCNMPIIIFHGNKDQIIYYGSSLKLKELYKQKIKLITQDNQGHHGITDNPDYLIEIQKIM